MRINYLGDAHKRAPTDLEHAADIVDRRKDDRGRFFFSAGATEVCYSAYLRLLGVMSEVEESKAPGQWTHLMKGVRDGDSSGKLLNKKDIKLDAKETVTDQY